MRPDVGHDLGNLLTGQCLSKARHRFLSPQHDGDGIGCGREAPIETERRIAARAGGAEAVLDVAAAQTDA
jgi:hypothetical protein